MLQCSLQSLESTCLTLWLVMLKLFFFGEVSEERKATAYVVHVTHTCDPFLMLRFDSSTFVPEIKLFEVFTLTLTLTLLLTAHALAVAVASTLAATTLRFTPAATGVAVAVASAPKLGTFVSSITCPFIMIKASPCFSCVSGMISHRL